MSTTDHLREVMNRVAPWVYITLVFISVIANVVLFTQQIGQDNRIRKDTEQIQRQRRDACDDQNRRHDNTISTLDGLIAALPEPQRTQAKKSERFTVLLINALAPHQDCEKLAPTP